MPLDDKIDYLCYAHESFYWSDMLEVRFGCLHNIDRCLMCPQIYV